MQITIAHNIPLAPLAKVLSQIGCELAQAENPNTGHLELQIRPSTAIIARRYDLEFLQSLPSPMLDSVCWAIAWHDRDWLATVAQDWFGWTGGHVHQVIAELKRLQLPGVSRATPTGVPA